MKNSLNTHSPPFLHPIPIDLITAFPSERRGVPTVKAEFEGNISRSILFKHMKRPVIKVGSGVLTEDCGLNAEVDSSVVLVNASTRFNDGNQLGLGAEIGIKTSKLHGFEPMGLEELTATKFIVYGQGQIRN